MIASTMSGPWPDMAHMLEDISDADLLTFVSREGLPGLFEPADGRRGVFAGLWPGEDMQPADLRAAIEDLMSRLPCDTYGGVEAVRWARDSYNQRLGCCGLLSKSCPPPFPLKGLRFTVYCLHIAYCGYQNIAFQVLHMTYHITN